MPVPIDTPGAVKDAVAKRAVNEGQYIIFYFDGRHKPPRMDYQTRGDMTPAMLSAIQREIETLAGFAANDSHTSLLSRGVETR